MVGSTPGFSALFIIEKGTVCSAAVTAWLESGNTIVEFWTSDRHKLRPNIYENLDSLIGGFPSLRTIARRHGIAIRKIERLSKSKLLLEAATQLGADTLVTMYTHQIVPADMINLFGGRTINCHPAFLPHYKGSQPRKSLLVDGCGEAYGGVTLHTIAPGIDEGDIIAQRQLPLDHNQSTGRWQAIIADAVKQMMLNEANAFLRGEVAASPQVAGSGNYRKIAKNEFFFTADKTFDQVAHLARVLAPDELQWIPNKNDGLRKTRYRVVAQVSNIGKPTGKPPYLSFNTIQADILDCRLSMPRLRLYHRFWYRIKSALQMRRLLKANGTFQQPPTSAL